MKNKVKLTESIQSKSVEPACAEFPSNVVRNSAKVPGQKKTLLSQGFSPTRGINGHWPFVREVWHPIQGRVVILRVASEIGMSSPWMGGPLCLTTNWWSVWRTFVKFPFYHTVKGRASKESHDACKPLSLSQKRVNLFSKKTT